MKKITTLLTILLISFYSFGAEFNFAEWQKAARSGYTTTKTYLDSLEPNDVVAIAFKINLGLSATHSVGKENGIETKEAAEQEVAKAKETFYSNLNILRDTDVFCIAYRIADYKLAASKMTSVNIATSFTPELSINYILGLYKNGAISKDIAISNLMLVSKREIKDYQFAALTKAVNSIPLRDLDGNAFMTREQKKDFYGNFIELNAVTTKSADFLGACVTQYNLVK